MLVFSPAWHRVLSSIGKRREEDEQSNQSFRQPFSGFFTEIFCPAHKTITRSSTLKNRNRDRGACRMIILVPVHGIHLKQTDGTERVV